MNSLLTLEDEFLFSCHKGLDCFNTCCRNINLYLTPYDIVRMKKRLGMDSLSFLHQYTIPLFMRAIGHPVVILKLNEDDEHTCPFVTPEGCGIYEDRPWSCRSYPLEPVATHHVQDFTIAQHAKCLGYNKESRITVKQWRESQKVAEHEAMNDLWAKITLHEQMNKIGVLDQRQRELFYLASFNIDQFRYSIIHDDLLHSYQALNPDMHTSIQHDDVALMKLAFSWLETALFSNPK
jgi:hypothetical protein